MPLTVTLVCATCTKRETHPNNWDFKGWFTIMPHDGRLRGFMFCGETCLASWAMRRQMERERAREAKA